MELEFLRKNPIAHRGLFDKDAGIPENSILAFEMAIEKNYPIEVDLHLLNDGKLVVFHDDNLIRMTGVNKKIIECNYDEIKDLKLNNTKYGIPLFSELLDLVDGRVPLLIEFKSDRKAGQTESKAMDLLKEYKGKYAVQSFNIDSLIWLKKNYPKIPRGQLSSNFKNDNMFFIKKFILSNILLNFITKPNFISYNINSFPNKRVENFRKSGKLVLSWTIRNNNQLKKAKEYSDNIIGENLEKLDLDLMFNIKK